MIGSGRGLVAIEGEAGAEHELGVVAGGERAESGKAESGEEAGGVAGVEELRVEAGGGDCI